MTAVRTRSHSAAAATPTMLLWVECEACGTWRRLPDAGGVELEGWTCARHPKHLRCMRTAQRLQWERPCPIATLPQELLRSVMRWLRPTQRLRVSGC